MAKSIAEIVAEGSSARPRRPYRAIVGKGQEYVHEVQRLSEEHDLLVATPARLADDESAPPKKLGAKSLPPRVYAIRERLAELADLMADYEGELTVEASLPDGEWKQWRLTHPARDENDPGYRDDIMIAGGFCNADDLIAELPRFVVEWEGEPLEAGDFDSLNLMLPDKKAIAGMVVALYEQGDDLPKLRSDLSARLKSETSSN